MKLRNHLVCTATANLAIAFAAGCSLIWTNSLPSAPVHVWEKVEIPLQATNAYANPYTDAQAWVELKGPGFERRCYGFWDGGNTFRVRVLATTPGKWTWRSGSQPAIPGCLAKRASSRPFPGLKQRSRRIQTAGHASCHA